MYKSQKTSVNFEQKGNSTLFDFDSRISEFRAKTKALFRGML